MKKLAYLTVIVLALSYSCKKDPGPKDIITTPKDSVTVTDAMARDSLYYLMKEVYLWYKEMPTVNKDNYSDPYKLMDAMRYKALDRFSFVADYTEWNNEMSGIISGFHGIRVGVDAAGKARIAQIYREAPMYALGVRRGWIIKSVNGIDIAAAIRSNNNATYNAAFGENKVGVTNSFVFTKPNGIDTTISSAKASFTTKAVLVYDTLHLSNGIAGHIVYDQFIDPSLTDLATVFAYFKANNVSSIILDLRYNPGGSLSVAQSLASYIAGSTYTGKTFSKITYNDKLTKYNTPIPFVSVANAVAVPKLVVITSRGTVSASELIINGLKPYITVVTVGDTTLGKPIGMNVWDVGKRFVFAPITFKIVNSLDQGDYFTGIPPTKLAADDITHDFSDRRETSLKEAIYYLEHGAVSTKSFTRFRNSPQYTEKPEWAKNMFIFPLGKSY
jgi:C-terminal processing protease CtpA/Prc